MVRWIAVLFAGLCVAAFGCGSGDDVMEMGDAPGEALRDVAAGGGADAVAQCLELAAKKQWSDALAPCTEAANEKPDDMRIKQALQEARTAAGSS